jgi:hypothetical protein
MTSINLDTLSILRQRISGWKNHWRVVQLARQVAAHSQADPSLKPVAFFNASARVTGLSQNAAFAMLTSWGLRLAGVPVSNFVCRAGMSHCVLGTNRQNPRKPPPCSACLRQSRRIYAGSEVYWFEYKWTSDLMNALKDLSVEELSNFEYHKVKGPLITPGLSVPLGRLVLSSIRWALRCHTLPDDEGTRYLLREYILSAYNIAQEFSAFLDETKPATTIIFNGIMYPEATALWVAQARGLRVITYEVGFQRYSAFFTEGEATAYPIRIPKEFELSPEQNARLDDYLEKRFQGQFTMAGIRFWPEMRGLDESFLRKIAQFRQMVPVFTNVVYDSSQVHANQVFPHMFAWLDVVLDLIRSDPETLFVIRAHPDEMRPGTAKQSRESVREWVKKNKVDSLPNVTFIDSQDFVSSYELVRRSKFVMVYNSSIGIESTLLGTPVLSGGKARYTQYPIVFFPENPQAFRTMADKFLSEEKIELPKEYQRNARRFLYYQLFRTSLSFEKFLQEGHRKGYVFLRPFSWDDLLPGNSTTVQVLVEGINSTTPHPQADPLNKGNEKEQLFLSPDDPRPEASSG